MLKGIIKYQNYNTFRDSIKFKKRGDKVEKVIRIDTSNGEYFTLTERELKEQFTNEQIEVFKNDSETYYIVTPYTPRQLQRARKLYQDHDYCENLSEELSHSVSEYDILKYLYGTK
jgi:hypothetical protein